MAIPAQDGLSGRHPREIVHSIVVGVGGSERSFTALRYALELGRGSEVAIRAVVVDGIRLNVAMSLAHGNILRHLMAEAEVLARAEGRRIAERIQRVADECDVEVTIQCETGSVVDCVADAASAASLLIVGKRGHRDEHGGFLGTNTELLARRVQVPILMTPRAFRSVREVVVAYAHQEPGKRSLEVAAQLCGALDVRLRVVTVAKDTKSGDEVLAQAKEMLRDAAMPAAFEVLRGHVATALSQTTTEGSILILGASSHSRAYHLLLGDVTVEVMRKARGPVLVSSKLGALPLTAGRATGG